MFSVETRINGILISHVYGKNITHTLLDHKEEGDVYSYTYTETETGYSCSGTILHKRKDGLTQLVSTIMLDVLKKQDGG